jgi:predicted  nucleic acid-binding Zn-ribbon protein
MSDQESNSRQAERVENDRRKNHLAMQAIETRVTGLEERISGIDKGLKSLQSELKRLTARLSGSEQFDALMAGFRLDVGKSIEKKEKQINKNLEDRLGLIVKDLDGINTGLTELRHSANALSQLKKDVKSLRDEDDRITAKLSDDRKLLDEVQKQYLENQETMASQEAVRRRENKAIPELSSEVATLRKRSDDQRAQLDLLQETIRKTSTSLDEFIARDEERAASYRSLIDEMKLTQYEHEKTWREWLNRFDTVNKTAVELENKLNALDDAQRKARLSQKGLDDATIRIERRINEIAEMQRLAEERTHQDWESYQADEQKRWKTYTVNNEEALSESRRQIESLKARLAALEDSTHKMNDTVMMLSEETQKKLQGFLELYHEWAATNSDIISRSRPR